MCVRWLDLAGHALRDFEGVIWSANNHKFDPGMFIVRDHDGTTDRLANLWRFISADVVLLGNFLDGLIDLTGTCGGGQADADGDSDIDEDDYILLYNVVAGVGP